MPGDVGAAVPRVERDAAGGAGHGDGLADPAPGRVDDADVVGAQPRGHGPQEAPVSGGRPAGGEVAELHLGPCGVSWRPFSSRPVAGSGTVGRGVRCGNGQRERGQRQRAGGERGRQRERRRASS